MDHEDCLDIPISETTTAELAAIAESDKIPVGEVIKEALGKHVAHHRGESRPDRDSRDS